LLLACILIVGFIVLGGWPLARAIWLLPAVHMLRAVATYLMLSRRIGLSHLRTFRALFGGIALGLVVVLGWEFSDWFPRATELSTAALLRLGFAGGLAMLVVVASRGILFGPELRTVIRGRVPSNRAGQIAQRVLGL
jgi:hypothetical protein